MSELFDDDEEDKALDSVDELEDAEDAEDAVLDPRQRPSSDARRRLEKLLEEKRLRDELEDFFDY